MIGPKKQWHVRRYQEDDAPAVERLAGEGPAPDEVLDSGGRAWTLLSDGRCVGYATVTPLPGLEGVVELRGFVAPGVRGQGLGSHVLRHVLQELSAAGLRRITHQVASLQAAPARFLRDRGFFLEHEEWEMALSLPAAHPPQAPPPLPPDVRLQTFPPAQAVDLFRRLYDDSFGGRPWYQPYSRRDVRSELLPGDTSREKARDILFLLQGEKAVGFVAVSYSGDEGEIEPMGVVRQRQGQGLGRFLLMATLRWFGERGVGRVSLGVWRSNEQALALYRRAGFRRVGRRYYLAYTFSG